MSKLFEIPYINNTGAFDVTPFIVLNTYEVSEQSVYKEWTDANGKFRKGVKRTQIKGSFDVKFFSQKDYADFMSALRDNHSPNEDYITVNLYENKSRTFLTSKDIYVEYEPANVEPSIGWSFNEEISITISER